VATLDALLAYWSGSDDYLTRVGNLRAGNIVGVSPLNSANVTNDIAADKLTGNAALDWNFAKLTAPNADTILDLDTADGELVN
jgi:hypothetical protein